MTLINSDVELSFRLSCLACDFNGVSKKLTILLMKLLFSRRIPRMKLTALMSVKRNHMAITEIPCSGNEFHPAVDGEKQKAIITEDQIILVILKKTVRKNTSL